MRTPRLASVLAFRLAALVGFAMGAQAALERWREPNAPWSSLIVHHGSHVLVLGFLLYVTMIIWFDRLVARPLRKIRLHLYRVAMGKLELVELPARVREVDELVASVNVMIRRMRLGAGDADAHRIAAGLRDLASRLQLGAPETAEAIAGAAAALELLAPPELAGARGGATSRVRRSRHGTEGASSGPGSSHA